MMKFWRGNRRLAFFILPLAFSLRLPGAGVDIACTPLKVAARQGEMVTLHFVVRNRSTYTLETAGNFFLSYHARDGAGNMSTIG